jgi:hypothetical protein
MKTKSFFSYKWKVSMVTAGLFLIAVGCNDPMSDDRRPAGPQVSMGSNDWVTTLNELFYDAGIIVPKGESIQEAVNATDPGAVIYIEPGQYNERITIDKPDIKLVGLKGDDGQRVIIGGPGQGGITLMSGAGETQIINIQDDNSTDNDVRSNAAARTTTGKKWCKVKRHKVTSRIAHYEFEVRLSDRPFDIVRLHRVVREDRPYHAVRTRGAIFMLHGASLTFEAVFLNAGTENPDPQTSISHYLASHDIDVWGLDFAWTLVPRETTDFSFMEDWGVERDMDHALAGMSIARLIRGLTGQGLGRLNLLGYSYGVGVAYGAAGRETREHPILRDIKGIVAVDQILKYDPAGDTESFRSTICQTAAQLKSQLDAGTYHSSQGVNLATIGALATNDPDGPSPLPAPFAGKTNYQVALMIGTSPADNNGAPSWHFVAGVFGETSFPVPEGLRFSDPARWIRLISSLPPYQPARTTYEMRACVCNEEDVTFDDYISDIHVPILYLGAGGAFGTYGYFTSSLTDSRDITNRNVALETDLDQRLFDFGHGDMMIANSAPEEVWEPLRQWLVTHNGHGIFY